MSSMLDGLIVIDGTVECASGCGREAQRVLLAGHEVPMLCDVCQDEAEANREAQEQMFRVRELMGRSGKTPKLMQWSLSTYPTDRFGTAALKAGREWLDLWLQTSRSEPVPNLLLIGNVGAGKSGLAWSLIREIVEGHATSARFVNWRVLLADMQDAMHDKSLRVQDALGLHRLPVLCIDDLGSERVTDWRREELANLVERREQNLLPTIITSNYTRRELAARLGHDDPTLGERIMSRLAENSVVVKFGGPDRRTEARRAA